MEDRAIHAALAIRAELKRADAGGFGRTAWYSYLSRRAIEEAVAAVLDGVYVTGIGQIMRGVHPAEACEGRHCVIHNPSDHHMRDWPTNWRDGGVFDIKGPHMERVCEHGCGHPDPDDLAYLESIGETGYGVHGCCGCCRPKPELQKNELAILPDGTTVGATSSGHLVARRHLPEFGAHPSCSQCGRDLHGYIGPLCRYCDGTAE